MARHTVDVVVFSTAVEVIVVVAVAIVFVIVVYPTIKAPQTTEVGYWEGL